MTKVRELLVVAKCQADLDKVFAAFQMTDVKDVTRYLDIRQYPDLTRSGIGEVLDRLIPTASHQRICVIVPKRDDETDEEWEMRAKCDSVLSIISVAYRDNFYVQKVGEF